MRGKRETKNELDSRSDDLFALMLKPVTAHVKPVGDQRFLLRPKDAQADSGERRPAAESIPSKQLSLQSVISYTDRKSSNRLHPIDAKRKLEKTQKEIKRARLAKRASKQQPGARNKVYAGREAVAASGDAREDGGQGSSRE
jgi:hypothetical protein